MELGMIGLGRMGGNMTRRLLRGGHRVVAYDSKEEAVKALLSHGIVAASSIDDLIGKLDPPRVIWLMVPSGDITENTITSVASHLAMGDIVLDGSNSNYRDSMRRASALAERGIKFMDVGTSGGIWGLDEGYSLMIGGDANTFSHMEPIFQTLAPGPDKGYGHVGPAGTGHFVKMIHNGIEYGLMQAYAEGFELMGAKREFNLDIAKISQVWRHGSVVRSWLLDMIAASLKEDPELDDIQAYVEDSGEGRWTVQESIDLGVPIPVIALSLQSRFRSRQASPFGAKLLAAMRNQFGGHAVRKSKTP